VTTPCGKDGSINPAILFGRARGGGDGDYRVGGRPSDRGIGLRHKDDSPRAEVFGPGNGLRRMANGCSSRRVGGCICSPGRAICSCCGRQANPTFAAATCRAAETLFWSRACLACDDFGEILKAWKEKFPSSCPNWRVSEFIQCVLDRTLG